MANVSSWLAKGVVEHDRIHGSNLEIPRKGRKWLVQITKVISARPLNGLQLMISFIHTEPQKTHERRLPPQSPIERILCLLNLMWKLRTNSKGTIDTHRVQADRREVDANLEPERLTKNLRALMYVESYRWKVDSPRGRMVQGLEMPELKMEILEWSIFLGGELPVFFENTGEVGWGKDDGAAQKVLRKWYFGE